MSGLKDLIIEEISFVPKAANKEKYLLFKEDNGGGNTVKNGFREIVVEKEIADSLEAELLETAQIEAMMKEAKLSPGCQNALVAAMKILAPFKNEIGSEITDLETLKKGGEGNMADEKKVEKKEELPPEVKEMIQKSEEAVELQKKESERIAKENDELKKEIATEREIRLKKEFLQKAEAIPFVAGEKEKMAEFLKGLDEEAEKYITGVLATANAQLEKSELFKELGSGNAASLDVVKRVEKAAEEEVAKDGKLTKEQAIVKVLESKPELYVEYEKQLQNANK